MPHLWLERASQRVSTLDLLDGSFVLLTGSDAGRWREDAARVVTSLGVKLTASRIGPGGDLRDPENGWTRRMGVSSDGAVLVRPDGFVAWRSGHLTSERGHLEQVLSRILCRQSTPTLAPVNEKQTVSR